MAARRVLWCVRPSSLSFEGQILHERCLPQNAHETLADDTKRPRYDTTTGDDLAGHKHNNQPYHRLIYRLGSLWCAWGGDLAGRGADRGPERHGYPTELSEMAGCFETQDVSQPS